MNDQLQQEIKQALEENPEFNSFENIIDEHDSPLNQPVKEKDIAGNHPADEGELVDEETSSSHEQENDNPFETPVGEPLDAPEQTFSSDPEEVDPNREGDQDDFELPNEQAAMMADTVLGMTNNFLSIGGGFFVKIKKHQSFFDFDQIVQVIDEQNQKNVQRIQLDELDKALLRPLLIQVLKKRAGNLTVEQQLIGAILSILVKKIQVIVEIRAEIKMLEDKILESIKGATAQKEPDDKQADDPDIKKAA